MSEMVTAIKTAFIEELKNNTWLDQQTIDASIDKVMHTLCTEWNVLNTGWLCA